MVMGEGLNLDDALALHYAVENCSRDVVKALLELGAADVNYPARPVRKTPLHIASEIVSPDMVAVLLDRHADPNVRTIEGITPLDILRTLTSDFLFKGAVPGLTHIKPNKLRLCLELVQSAALVISREEGNATANAASISTHIYPQMNDDHSHTHTHNSSSNSSGNIGNLNMDSRLVYLNLGAAAAQISCNKMDVGGGREDNSHHNTHHHRHGSSHDVCDTSMYHHPHHEPTMEHLSGPKRYLVIYMASAISMKLIGKLQDDTIFVKRGHDEKDPFAFKTVEEQVIDELDRDMRVG
ncbi:hypothetical protein L2E82_49336 [Cichorium intybus]|uniref:Uncharacterized protein n=1 Tax=Cichorium intybus TaxID=13427 RepID=A0ACB8Z0L6_CICIN|nr:hypothetical protein L2E82_49336 [Cichorium intybus]